MSDATGWIDHYQRVYTAAAQMVWLQGGAHSGENPSWPAERIEIWASLAESLTEAAETAVSSLNGFDPAHHLLSRRGPEGQPITFAEAVSDWKQRMAPGQAPPAVHKGNGYYGLTPGSAVVVTAPWLFHITFGNFDELDARLAPGRPPVTLDAQIGPLADLLHGLAAQLRTALTETPSDPLPTHAVDAPPENSAWPRGVTRTDYDLLCRRARAAARSLPSEAQRRADRDFSVKASAIKAADKLLRVLDGEDTTAWMEFPKESGPSRHTAKKGVQTRTLLAEATHLATITNKPAPRPPRPHEVMEDYEHPVEPSDQVRLIPIPRASPWYSPKSSTSTPPESPPTSTSASFSSTATPCAASSAASTHDSRHSDPDTPIRLDPHAA